MGRLSRKVARLSALLLKGGELAAAMQDRIAGLIDELARRGGRSPLLATLLAGDNPSARAYRSSIVRTFARIGIEHLPTDLPAETTPEDLLGHLRRLNGDPAVTGVLVLMPLPAHLPPALVLEHLSPLKDVDGITPTNAGRLHLGLPSLRPSTPQGGIELLDHYNIPLEGSRAIVVGRSNVVGRPLATLLTLRHATVTVCHRRTRELPAICREAELLCVAAGSPGLIRAEMVRPGATVIDFGVNVVDGRIVGDADFEAVREVAGAISPVPGGTGPVTALVLARNTVAAGFAALEGTLDALWQTPPFDRGR
jgi:methylenetetrahydrofolate dehydrogenase (NADP+)/methenyltetrahydrofolate cyclohydrolase